MVIGQPQGGNHKGCPYLFFGPEPPLEPSDQDSKYLFESHDAEVVGKLDGEEPRIKARTQIVTLGARGTQPKIFDSIAF